MENNKSTGLNRIKKILTFLENHHIIALLTYIALFVAFAHLIELKIVSKKTEELNGSMDTSLTKLDRIVSEMPTQSIGAFPDNLEGITKFLLRIVENPIQNSNKDSILIVTDGIGYGQFSNPRLFEAYKDLLKKIDKINEVHLIVHSDSIKNSIRNEQFEKDTFDSYKKNNKKFEVYRNYWSAIIGTEQFDAQVYDMKSFHAFLRKKVEEFKIELINAGIDIYTISIRQSIYLWVVKDEAIISFSTQVPIRAETSLITREPNLISFCLFRASDLLRKATKIKKF